MISLKNMNFNEKLAAYKNSAKPQPCLEPATFLPGSRIKEKIEKLMETRKMSTRPPSFGLKTAGRDTIIICLVIVDKLHHEEIWRDWIEKGTSAGVNIRLLLHAKIPDRLESTWVRAHALSKEKSFQPEWNSPEVVRAMLALLKEGNADPRAARFVFGTESCLPIYPAADVHKALMKEDVSWLAARHSAEDKFEAATCFGAVDDSIFPRSAVWKSLPGWIMLTWRHVYEIVSLSQCIGTDLVCSMGPPGPWSEHTGGVFAPEEIFFPTMLAVLGYLRDITPTSSSNGSKGGDEVRRRMVTYAEWPRKGAANPVSFLHLDTSLLTRLRRSGSLFARKFGPDSCSLSDWLMATSNCTYTHEICGGVQVHNSSVHMDETCLKLQDIWLKNQTKQQTEESTMASMPTSVVPRGLRIAMLMIVVDDVPHETIWREWARGVDIDAGDFHSDSSESSVKFLIHGKELGAITSPWVRSRLAKTFHLQPTWGSVELTDVMIRLLHEALDADDTIDALCFCSDSCIPVVPFQEFQRAILNYTLPNSNSTESGHPDVSSWLRYGYEPTNGYAKQKQFDILKGRIPGQCIAKADQWLLLSRKHAKQVLELSNEQALGRPLLQSFRGVSASDEMYFPTCLSLLGILPPAVKNKTELQANDIAQVRQQQLTYCEWRSGDPSPRTFTDLTQSDITNARTQGCLLLRKLKSPYSGSSQRFGAAQYGREAQEQRRQQREDLQVLQCDNEWRSEMLSKWLILVGQSLDQTTDSQVHKRPKT